MSSCWQIASLGYLTTLSTPRGQWDNLGTALECIQLQEPQTRMHFQQEGCNLSNMPGYSPEIC